MRQITKIITFFLLIIANNVNAEVETFNAIELPERATEELDDLFVNQTNDSPVFSYDFKLTSGISFDSDFFLGNQNDSFDLIISFEFDLSYHHFFLESKRKNSLDGTLGRVYTGYHLGESDGYQFDIIGGSYVPVIDKKDEDGNVIPELISLEKREADFNFGVRLSKLNDEIYYSFEVVYDLASLTHSGWIIDSYIGRAFNLGNWDIDYGIGYTWYSKKVINYFAGVKPIETNESLSSYHTGASSSINFEFSLQYPLSESWIFEAGISHNLLSDNLNNSPLIVNKNVTIGLIGFGYVF